MGIRFDSVAMVERRNPLVLSSTRSTLRSVLNSSQPSSADGDRVLNKDGDLLRGNARLSAGILRWRKDGENVSDAKLDSLDDSALVGLSTQLLKRLSINSGSLVCPSHLVQSTKLDLFWIILLLLMLTIEFLKCKVVVKNIEIGIQRVAQVVVLDPPKTTLEDASLTQVPVSDSLHTMLVFPTYDLMGQQLLDQEVAYLSPMLAFNLSLHISCLKSLVHRGNGVLEKYFEAKCDEEFIGKSAEDGSKIGLDLEPVSQVPGYASHLRVSFVKIPECGTIPSLKVNSSFEAEERQGLIDSALQKYFGTDRQLSRGDIFRIYIDWNCGSSICNPCSQRLCSESDDYIYFKVILVFIFARKMLILARAY